MEDQERELIERYRKLGPEAKRFIMSTVITAVTAENTIKRQYGLAEGNSAGRGSFAGYGGEIGMIGTKKGESCYHWHFMIVYPLVYKNPLLGT